MSVEHVKIITGKIKYSCKDVVITDKPVSFDDMKRVKSVKDGKKTFETAGLRTGTGHVTGQRFMSRAVVAVVEGSIGIFPDDKLKSNEGIPYSKGDKFTLEGEDLVHSMRFVRHGIKDAVITVIIQA